MSSKVEINKSYRIYCKHGNMKQFKPYGGNSSLVTNLIHANTYYIADMYTTNQFNGMLQDLRYQGYTVKIKAVTW